MAWEDVIIYIPDQDKSLRAYEWKVNGLRLRVTRHICDPDKWFISFRPFYDLKEIGNVGDDIEKLKEKALDEARWCAERLPRQLDDPRDEESMK